MDVDDIFILRQHQRFPGSHVLRGATARAGSHLDNPLLFDVNDRDTLDWARNAPMRTRHGGFDVASEAGDDPATPFLNDVDSGQCPEHYGCQYEPADALEWGSAPTATAAATAASKKTPDALLNAAQDFFQIGWRRLLVSPAPRVFLRTARFIPGHVFAPHHDS